MDFLKIMEISGSALSAQRIRMNVISVNLANINSTRTPGGGPYRRKEVIFSAAPISSPFEKRLKEETERCLRQVKIIGVAEDMRPFKKVHDPSHPDADKEGYVTLPNVNLVEEMIDMLSANHAYEANIAVINATKEMVIKALEIGR